MMFLFLLACADPTLHGAAAKGPYILGSSVNISEIDDGGDPTGAVWSTVTSNDLGAFSLDGVSTGPVRIEVAGYHFDEVRGALSSSALTLHAYGELGSSDTIYVNTVTQLSSQRVLRLLEDGASMDEATSQAEGELLSALAIHPTDFDPGATGVEMTLLDGDTDAAAWLLAVSAVFVQAAIDEAASEVEVDATLQELHSAGLRPQPIGPTLRVKPSGFRATSTWRGRASPSPAAPMRRLPIPAANAARAA